jgi:hypothetical protein
MAEPKPFPPVKPLCGLIASSDEAFRAAEEGMVGLLGPVEARSPRFVFDATDYYARDMGPGLARVFLSFRRLMRPERLAGLKLAANALEASIGRSLGPAAVRAVNIEPGYLTKAALIMATTKDFSHRVPLADGIYGHLELLFSRSGVRLLDWTYPDFRQSGYQAFLLDVRRSYLAELKEADGGA